MRRMLLGTFLLLGLSVPAAAEDVASVQGSVPAAAGQAEETAAMPRAREFPCEAWLEMPEDNPAVGAELSYHVKVAVPQGWELQVPENVELAAGTRTRKEQVTLKRAVAGDKTEFELVVPVVLVRLEKVVVDERQLAVAGPAGEKGVVRVGKIVVRPGTWFPTENEPQPGTPSAPMSVAERNWLLIWALALLGVVGVAVTATVLVLNARRGRVKRPGPPPRPAHEVALEKLSVLRDRQLEKQGAFGALYTELSEILREYLGGRWRFDSLDMTTTELLAAMGAQKLEYQCCQDLTLALQDFDLVKFAKVVPQEAQAAADLARVVQFVERTREVPAAAVPAMPVARSASAPGAAPPREEGR